MKYLGVFVLTAAALASACADPAANKPKATTTAPSSASPAVPASSTAAPSTTDVFASFKPKGTAIDVDAATSKIEFTGSKVTGKHDGGFKTFTGKIDLVGEKAEDSAVVFEIEMASVFTDADGLTKHLQNEDFFEVGKFPKASFVSTKIVADAAKGAGNYTVTGDMEIRGVKKSITFPAKITVAADAVTVNSEFAINRKDFGIAYAGKADDLIRDDVVLRLDLKAPRKK
ncbi:MAG TPA: YceI family protein [Pyrinomonadaceae bacterium]|nr:YceI family protein [Pyrinomonadaceae bacterium]